MFRVRKLSQLAPKSITTLPHILEPLKDRTLIRVSGLESKPFLQGLITNDMEHLGVGTSSMFTMFLNNLGRILYDSIIYRFSNENEYYVECDTRIEDKLEKYLKMFRLKRKIDIESMNAQFKVNVLFPEVAATDSLISHIDLTKQLREVEDLIVYRDPRLANLGYRIISKNDVRITDKLQGICNLTAASVSYRWLRYSLGVGEGIDDLPPSELFPLECNADYLHGISFQKGCYIGQELTARIHHTGVVRKRLMPINFTKTPSTPPDEKIIHENVNLGKFRGLEKNVGLGLLRFSKALAIKEIKIGDGIGTVSWPHWWPVEASQDKMNVSKIE